MREKKRHLRIFRCLALQILFCFMIFLPSGMVRSVAANPHLAIENVGMDRTVLRPGEEVKLSFYLTKEARVSLFIYSSDYEAVRRLIDGEKRPAGMNSVIWDGRDDGGKMLPDEAYLAGIIAESDGGEKAVYDPTIHSGGEMVDIPVKMTEEFGRGYRIYFSLPAPSRVSIRAGIRMGPLLRTILDSKPLPAGDYAEVWDGMDDTGRIHLMKEPKRILQVSGFLLPKGAIIVQGGREDYSAYARGLRSKAPSADKRSILTNQSVRENVMKRIDRGVSPQFLVRQSMNVSPKFRLHLHGDRSTGLSQRSVTRVSGQAGFTVEVSPESLPSFNELRYEIVVFVDGQRFDEEEQAYPSYTYMLDTRQLRNGEHLVTFNLVSMTGQIGSYSFKIDVQN